MRQPAATLDRFYNSRLGIAAASLIVDRVSALWHDCEGDSILGIGYATPLLDKWREDARSCISVFPEEIGPSIFMTKRGNASLLASEHRLPFSDASFDKIVLLHALEEAESPRLLLREAWRLLAPEGRIIVATTNRRSLWSVAEAQAFGHGRPWTRRQLTRFLSDSLFHVTASTTAVHMPPLDWRIITSASRSWERAGDLVLPGLGGIVLVEATKRLYAKPGGSAPAPVTNVSKRPSLPQRDPALDHHQKNQSNVID